MMWKATKTIEAVCQFSKEPFMRIGLGITGWPYEDRIVILGWLASKIYVHDPDTGS
jgi:hypothetical protein